LLKIKKGGVLKPTQARKILIVDDEAHIRLLIQQTLEDLEDQGVEILSADNGQEALRLAQAERPQLVFLDVMMPNIDGLQVCHQIKHELELADVYVVILTAKGQKYDLERSQEAGADKYMTKPFDPDELLSLANEVIFE
jgi:CheY-like chemotaxis protein